MMVDYQTPIDVLTRPNDISASDDPLAPARKKARNTRPNPKPSTRVRGEPELNRTSRAHLFLTFCSAS